MKYDVYLSPRAKKQYKKFDVHMRHKIRTKLLELEEDPSEKGSLLQGFSPGLRKIKIFHAGVQYRAVYDITLIKQLAAANPCAVRKSSFSFFTTQSFPGSSGS